MRQGLRGDRPIPGAHGLAYHTYNYVLLFEVFGGSHHTVIFTLWTGGAGMRDEVTDMSVNI